MIMYYHSTGKLLHVCFVTEDKKLLDILLRKISRVDKIKKNKKKKNEITPSNVRFVIVRCRVLSIELSELDQEIAFGVWDCGTYTCIPCIHHRNFSLLMSTCGDSRHGLQRDPVSRRRFVA